MNQASARSFSAIDFSFAVAWFAGYLVLMITIPYYIPTDASVSSGASLEGYNSNIAYLVAVGWSLLGIIAFAARAFSLRPVREPMQSVEPLRLSMPDQRDMVELCLVFAAVFLLYFPVFLAKSGPFIEDSTMLSMLHRMQGGQQPFVDFKFLYSPLMIYPVHGWMELFGYSKLSYYTYLAILVGFQFVLLLAIVQRFVPAGPARYMIFLLIACFFVETLLGTHWNGTRRLIPVVALLMVAINPRKSSTIVSSGLIFGFMLAYSHDFGVAGLIGVIAIYGMAAIKDDFRGNLLACTAIGMIASVTWLVITVSLMGSAFPEYIKLVLYLLERYSLGEAGFTFRWTINSVAVFGLVWLACLAVARGMPAVFSAAEPAAGDRLLLAALAYAFVIFKTGLNRCDFWHLDAVIIPLLFAYLLPLPRNVFKLSASAERLSHGLIVIAAVTYLIGSAPTGSYYMQGYLQGMKNTLQPANPGTTEPFATAAPSLLWESGTEPDPDLVALSRFLASEPYLGKPVLFYLETWNLDKMIGVYRTEYQVDDLVFSDKMAFRMRDYLVENPAATILIRRPSFERLFGFKKSDDFSDYLWQTESAMKRLGAITSSVHYSAILAERQALEQRLGRTIAPYIVANYEILNEFGNLVLLSRTSKGNNGPHHDRHQ